MDKERRDSITNYISIIFASALKYLKYKYERNYSRLTQRKNPSKYSEIKLCIKRI